MDVNRQAFMDEGFLVLGQVIEPGRVQRMRHLVEIMVDRQKALAAAQRSEGQPLGGAWYATAAPRVNWHQVVDADTAEAVDFCLEENTLGVSQQIVQAPETAISGMQGNCSSIEESGYTNTAAECGIRFT